MREFAEFALAAFVASLAIEAVDTFAGRNTAWILAFITLLLYLMYAAGGRAVPSIDSDRISSSGAFGPSRPRGGGGG